MATIEEVIENAKEKDALEEQPKEDIKDPRKVTKKKIIEAQRYSAVATADSG